MSRNYKVRVYMNTGVLLYIKYEHGSMKVPFVKKHHFNVQIKENIRFCYLVMLLSVEIGYVVLVGIAWSSKCKHIRGRMYIGLVISNKYKQKRNKKCFKCSLML